MEQESDFKSVDNRWRPKNLLQIRQVQLLLSDVRFKRDNLDLARDELALLDYAEKYLKYLRRMQLWVRDASYAWKADQLKFLTSVVGFYEDYASILRLLRTEALSGKFTDLKGESET